MSTIKIVYPDFGESVCATCILLQLSRWRNDNKEQWNELNNDGKVGRIVEMRFDPDFRMLWEMPITSLNGSLICLTHYFIQLNTQIETMNKPQLETGSNLQLFKG